MINRIRLREIAEIFNGKTPSKLEQRDHGHPVLKIRDVDEHGRHRGTTQSFVDPELAAKYPSKWVRVGDTLILNAAHNADYVASKTYFADNEVVGSLATGEWLLARPRAEAIHPAFLNYWLRSSRTRDAIRFLVKGIHLYPKDVAELELFLPVMAEQLRIVDLLSRAEGIVRLRREAQQKAAELIPAIFIDMFGDPATNPKGWQMSAIEELCPVQTGATPRKEVRLYYEGGTVPWIRTGEVRGLHIRDAAERITELAVRDTNCKVFPVNTVLVAMYGQGQTRGRTGMLMTPAATNQACAAILPSDKINAMFLFEVVKLQYERLRAMGRGGNQANLNLGMIKAFQVPRPPMEAQLRFVERVTALESIQRQQAAAARMSLATFDALLARAFA